MALILQNAATLLKSGELADFTLKCDDYEWRVHRFVLASGSKVFQKMCTGEFKEASTRVLELFEDEPEMVARMLLCLYTSDYPIQVHEKSEPSNQSVSQLVEQGRTHTLARDYIFETNPYLIISKMFVLAEKYDMSGLKDVCVEKLQTNKPSAEFSKLKRFLGSLDHIYSSTPPICNSLRIAAAKIVQQRYCEILADPATKGMLQAACLAHSQLGWDLISTLFVAKDLLCTDCQICLRVPEDLVDAFDISEWCGDSDEHCLCGLTQICGRGACLAQIKKHVLCPECLSVKNVHQGDFFEDAGSDRVLRSLT